MAPKIVNNLLNYPSTYVNPEIVDLNQVIANIFNGKTPTGSLWSHKTTIKDTWFIRELSRHMELGLSFGWVKHKILISKSELKRLYAQEEVPVILASLFTRPVVDIKKSTTP